MTIKQLLFTALFSIVVSITHSQCLKWSDPDTASGWLNFKTVPCNGEFTEDESFEIFQSEAYALPGILKDGNYTFSACNGAGAGTWEIDYTILSPTGRVDAFGHDSASSCSITWTATEPGTYLVVINKAGACGIADTIDNGYARITTNYGGLNCPPPPVFKEGAESFEGLFGALPTCWNRVDADGDGKGWQIINFDTLAFNGNNAIVSFSWDPVGGEALTPDNYLFTPQLKFGENDSLYYVIKTLNADFPAEKYSVLISTTGNDTADFNTEIFSETLTADAAEWQARSINLSAYNNQLVYIAFRHHSSADNVGVVLDGISLPGEMQDCNSTAITHLADKPTIQIHPNPATYQLFISSSLPKKSVIAVIDVTGQIVLKYERIPQGNLPSAIDISSLAPGTYLLRVQSGNNSEVLKFIKI
ncbi:MAG: choice-of-anchor J domain-containing protein [Bacteroidia bacterium]|nr:choice-of-anchor J domain-containing protein [Bacteroidia bacterium]MCC6769182.1 choice-of-anchor J domain-containing protein [Bacteroidia bacterium]